MNKRILRRHPGFLVVSAFGSLIAFGTALLILPVSHRVPGAGPNLSDSLFTAASAVTVTGLAVVDTRQAWSPFGEVVILALIQVGGLGIMTLAGFMGILLNRRMGLRSGLIVGTEIGLSDPSAARHLVRNIVRFVVASEATVTLLLWLHFQSQPEHSAWRSFHLSVFHSISAFNNAGFSTLEGGLERYVSDWYVSLVIAAAIIVGGIGFPVVFELRTRWRRPRSWSLHTKVTLGLTALLLGGGTLVLAVTEWTNPATFGNLSSIDHFVAAFFHSASARTAGFNTVPIGAMRPGSLLLLILLMVIGASSASTGGGIKTSTVAVVITSTFAEFRGDAVTTLFHRRLPEPIQRQALSLVIAALGTVGTATFILAVLQPEVAFSQWLFEAASAFGTVGLSTGATTALDTTSRIVVVALMFVGRVGPITFGSAVLFRHSTLRYKYPEEPIIVG